MGRISLASAGWGARDRQQQVEDQQRDAEIDRRVGEVEDEEVAAEGVQVEKVDDRAVDQAIVAVADRAADDQAEAEADQGCARAPQPQCDQRRDDRASTPAAASARPPISCANRLKEMPRFQRKARSRNGVNGAGADAGRVEIAEHQRLRRAVERDDGDDGDDADGARRASRPSLDAELAQRRRVAWADVGIVWDRRSPDRNSATNARI